MPNVALISGGILFENGLIQSNFRDWYDDWCWEFYENRHWNPRDNTLNEGATCAYTFVVFGMYDMSRDGQKVTFTYKPYEQRDSQDFTLIFADGSDARNFARKAQAVKSKMFGCLCSQ